MIAKTILFTLAVLLIAEGFFVSLFPKSTKGIMKKLAKEKRLRKFGIIELIIGLLLLASAFLID